MCQLPPVRLLVLSVAGLLSGWPLAAALTGILVLWAPTYLCLALLRVHGGHPALAALRTLLLAAIYVALLFGATVSVAPPRAILNA